MGLIMGLVLKLQHVQQPLGKLIFRGLRVFRFKQ